VSSLPIADMDDEIFWPWLAGFVDGEGSITICHRHDHGYESYRVQMNIVNSRLDILEALRARLGGDITKKKSGFGTSCYSYRLSSNLAKLVLSKIQPYLQIKSQQAAITLRFQLQRRIPIRGKGSRGGRIPDLETKATQAELCKQIQAINGGH
jgi:hypothetical protein